jgi:hypothetical protein
MRFERVEKYELVISGSVGLRTGNTPRQNGTMWVSWYGERVLVRMLRSDDGVAKGVVQSSIWRRDGSSSRLLPGKPVYSRSDIT